MYRMRQRYVAVAATIILCLFFLLLQDRGSITGRPEWTKGRASSSTGQDQRPAHKDGGNHPIDSLIRTSRVSFKQLLAKRSLTLEQAASRYRERRGRHPPPGFDVWFAEAQRRKAIVVEEFFDRIHHDINPFWGVKPRDMRVQAHAQPEVIRVRGGKVSFVTEHPNRLSLWQLFLDKYILPHLRRPPWIQLWTELVEEMLPHLPDLDMAINVIDETRILVPWEKIDRYSTTERQNRKLIDPADAISTYSGLTDIDTKNELYEPKWITGEANKYWDHLRAACPPASPARNVSSLASFGVSIEYPLEPMPYTYHGFVENFTAARDPCQQPHLRGMHGTFIESVSMSTLHELFPMFGQTKLPQNNELLIPGAMYLSADPLFSGGGTHGSRWDSKKDGLIWRGVASGGRNRAESWWHFQRHRWVQMMNGTTVSALEAGEDARAPSFKLLPADTYNVPTQWLGQLGEWVSTFADVGFIDLWCFPDAIGEDGKRAKTCEYTSPLMGLASNMPMREQYEYKYLPDVDGNSFSGRWRAFLHSTSMPLKATIYAEWHDDRMIPWVHFVPFDNTFMDIYAIMDYFLNGHDDEARRIADEGREWAELVHRRDDMMLYVWRLLLEYARVVDDKRDQLAFVEDLRDR